jgi:hypothetical protein
MVTVVYDISAINTRTIIHGILKSKQAVPKIEVLEQPHF